MNDRTGNASCPVCGGPAAREPFRYDWGGRRFWIMRCGECTHQFVHPPITSDEQEMIFDDGYFSAGGGWAGSWWDLDYLAAERELRIEAREILAMLPLRSGRLLDIGCAGGVFLDEARRRGFSVEGVELNPSMARAARERFGIEPVGARVEDVDGDRWDAAFDAITFLDVLEHLPAPGAALTKARRWLAPGGCLLIRGPLKSSGLVFAKEAARRLLGIVKSLPGRPLDANLFNVRSMETLLCATGFEAIEYISRTGDFSNILARPIPAK